MTTFTSEDREKVFTIDIEGLKEFIRFGTTNFDQGSMLFGSEFLQDAILIADELLRIKQKEAHDVPTIIVDSGASTKG